MRVIDRQRAGQLIRPLAIQQRPGAQSQRILRHRRATHDNGGWAQVIGSA